MNKNDNDVLKIVLSKLDSIERKVDKTHKYIFESNGHGKSILDIVHDNTDKIMILAKEEKGKFVRYIITAGKVAISISAVGTVVLVFSAILTKLL